MKTEARRIAELIIEVMSSDNNFKYHPSVKAWVKMERAINKMLKDGFENGRSAIELIAAGDDETADGLYGLISGYKELKETLDEVFNGEDWNHPDPDKSFLVVLDTMWGDRRAQAPRWFVINPTNRSGMMLYRLTGVSQEKLLVTNVCRYMETNPNIHGKPDVGWTTENLTKRIPKGFVGSTVLVCGSVARKTVLKTFPRSVRFRRKMKVFGTEFIFIDHPAARNWSEQKVKQVQKLLGNI